ncbi:MAG: beta-propeller fold lactonase family protein [Eubacteriales bacterium]|nr:beta-propeller fold lactonase family protein [Eubacteriales bacterium]
MNREHYMYVSSWKEHGGTPGLSVYRFDEETGEIVFLKQLDQKDSVNCSCVVAGVNRMYLCNEVVQTGREAPSGGRIFVYELNPANGDARRSAAVFTECPNPAYVELDPTGQYLVAAHHSITKRTIRHRRATDGMIESVVENAEADVQLWHLNEEGIPDCLLDNIDHAAQLGETGEAHPHCCVFSPSGELIAVADKGTGMLRMYTIDRKRHRLRLLDQALTDREGAHPRYVVFHPDKPFLFVNHEASCDGKMYVSSFRYEANGRLVKIATEDALEPGHAADPDRRLEQQGFAITPDGKYLYTLLNAVDQIGVLAVDGENGSLRRIANVPVKGIWPRGMGISPNGKFLITTCLVSGEIIPWRIGEDGLLTQAGEGAVQKGASYLSFF